MQISVWTWRYYCDKLIGTHMLPKQKHQLGSSIIVTAIITAKIMRPESSLDESLVREKQSLLGFALWTWNYFSTFTSHLSNSFQKMKHLFQSEERVFWGKEKINSLGWSYYFPFILLIVFFLFAYFPGFNLSYSISILLPSIFQNVLLLFSECLIFQTLRNVVSNQSCLHCILSFLLIL